MSKESKCSSNPLLIPLAIVICGALIAMAVLFNDGDTTAPAPVAGDNKAAPAPTAPTPPAGDPLAAINPVTEDDHIRGNPDASIFLVEYSDYDCPFCQRFHDTMKQVMDQYGEGGQVAWVYRHLPLAQIHPNANRVSLASECVAEMAGDAGFWSFSDLVFAERDPNGGGTDMARLAEFATRSGVEDEAAFNTCLDEARHQDDVQEDITNANAIGGRGTPYSVLIKGDQRTVVNGAQPFEQVRAQIEALLQ